MSFSVVKRIKKKRKKNKNHNRINKGWIFLLGIVILLVGIMIILFAYILLKEEDSSILRPFFLMLGQILVSISATALLFEHFGYVDYAVKRLSETFTRDEVIKNLSFEMKKDLKDKLSRDLYLKNSDDEDSFELLTLVENDMDKILSDYFYTDFTTYVDFFVYSDKKYIKKEIRRIFTVKPIVPGKKCSLKTVLFLRTHTINITDIETNIKIKSLKINGAEIDEDEYSMSPKENEKDGDCYDIEYMLILKKAKLLNFSDKMNVDIVYETYAEYTDKTYSITIDKPCKHFDCFFNIDTSIYDITLKGNGFMCYGKDSTTKKREIKTFSGKTLKFLNWILPGDGVVAIVKEKEQ